MDSGVAEARAALGLDTRRPCLALLPGSRGSEIARLATPFLDTARWLQERHPGLQVIAGLANESTAAVFMEKVHAGRLDAPPEVHVGRTRQVMAAADVVLTASGTASLETLADEAADGGRLYRFRGNPSADQDHGDCIDSSIFPYRTCWPAPGSCRNSFRVTCAPRYSAPRSNSTLTGGATLARIAAGMMSFGPSTSSCDATPASGPPVPYWSFWERIHVAILSR